MKGVSIRSAWLVTNYTCNNNCGFCYARHSLNEDRSQMSFEFARDVIDELVRINVKRCTIIGGEPTLYTNLTAILKYGTKSGLLMNIVTNGRKLANKYYLSQLIDAGVNHISISVEAACRDDYKTSCGVDGFDQTAEGIRNCISAGISTSSITTICASNYAHIVNIAQYAYSLGLKRIILNFGVPSLDVSDGGDQYLPPNELGKVAYETFCALKSKRIPHKFYGTIPLCSYTDEMRDEMIRANVIPKKTVCQLFFGSGIVFEPDGLVTPCTHWVNKGLFKASDNGKFLLADKLDDLWDDKDGDRVRFSKKLHRYTSINCKLCSLWGDCIGGCPLLWNKFNPDEHTKPIIK